MRLIRVFPRRTKLIPDDPLAAVNRAPTQRDVADEVHISVVFDRDIPRAEELASQWKWVAPVKIGGPALGDSGGEFIPGRYVKRGVTVTHRGCPNRCWFCRAWKIEGTLIREISIKDGYIVQDNNLLACSKEHQTAVFQMLRKQQQRPLLRGGFEAARLTPWHVNWLVKLRPKVCWFAYDTPDDLEPLINAARLLRGTPMIRARSICCYVLIGYRGDTMVAANERLTTAVQLGFFPQSMLYNEGMEIPDEADRLCWRRFHRTWANRVIVGTKVSRIRSETLYA